MADDLTPTWCKLCEMWVPKEREPHRSARDDGTLRELHVRTYSLSLPSFLKEDEARVLARAQLREIKEAWYGDPD